MSIGGDPLAIPAADLREPNLPIWAQDLINETRRSATEAHKAMLRARLETNPDHTDTVIDPYATTPIGLPLGADVTFRAQGLRGAPETRLAREHWIRVRRRSDGYLEIVGATQLVFSVQSSNVMHVHTSGQELR